MNNFNIGDKIVTSWNKAATIEDVITTVCYKVRYNDNTSDYIEHNWKLRLADASDIIPECKFKPGDVIKVIKRVVEEKGYSCIWMGEQNKFIDNTYIVDEVGWDGVTLTHKDKSFYRFPPASLELIQRAEDNNISIED